jgi:hypothetical protein
MFLHPGTAKIFKTSSVYANTSRPTGEFSSSKGKERKGKCEVRSSGETRKERRNKEIKRRKGNTKVRYGERGKK